MPNGTNNNKEMDIQAINQSREIQQQKAIQQLIDSGLVQSEKTKFTINQGAGAVPPANNANEKAAADAISSLYVKTLNKLKFSKLCHYTIIVVIIVRIISICSLLF